MRIDIVENSGERLRLAVGTNVPLYGFFGLLFLVLGGVCIRYLAMGAPLGPSFESAEASPVAGSLLGFVCIGSGLLILAGIQRVSLVADRAADTLVISRRLLWTKEQQRRIAIADVDSVHAIPFTLQTFSHETTSFSVRLKLRGEDVREAIGLTFLPMFTQADAMELAQVIRGWLRSDTRFTVRT